MKVVLCILDGWGYGPDSQFNAIAKARTPNWDRLCNSSAMALLDCSGRAVGLPEGCIGNSEVGHLTIGAGRVVPQSLMRIDEQIHAVDSRPAFVDFVHKLRVSGGRAHVWGLFSPIGVHAHSNHIKALVECLKGEGLSVFLHAVLDGRDSPPKSCLDFCVNQDIHTISGRYYAMDRDSNWERTQAAYENMVAAQGERFQSFEQAINCFYDSGLSDEFIPPAVIGDYQGFKPNDGLVIANFRPDRVRQMLSVFMGNKTGETELCKYHILGMMPYGGQYQVPSLFEKPKVTHTLGQVIADSGLSQLRIAETEKYAHVTFFFSGGSEELFRNEERVIVPSPKVSTYDLMPEMSAYQLTQEVLSRWGDHDLVVMNYANPDMVGHSGDLEATIKSVEVVDECLGALYMRLLSTAAPMCLIVTADHGNAELMFDAGNQCSHTAHTLNRVPFLGVKNQGIPLVLKREGGGLAAIAPTILAIMGLDAPAAMEGKMSLV